MRTFIIAPFLLCAFAFAGVDSSIDIPSDKHQKYTLGNQKNHPTIRLEGERYFANLAKISKTAVVQKMSEKGYAASSVSLEDRASQLVYVVYAKDVSGKKYRFFVDAGNGKALTKEEI